MSDFNIKTFKFWCQKVLPLVYDDELSYYEVLCKVVQKLNEVIDDVNKLPEYIRELISDGKLKEILSAMLAKLEEQIASANEGSSETATDNKVVGDLVWVNNFLYRVIKTINTGDKYVLNSNIEKITIEDAVKELKATIANYMEVNQTNASKNLNKGELVWYNNKLCLIMSNIAVGNAYVENVNYSVISVEDWINKLVNTETSERKDADTNINNSITKLNNSLTQETDERKENDLLTNKKVDAEISDRKSAIKDVYNKYDKLYEEKPINVLTLGVKNDGSEDCSTILNEYDAPLFFPAGKYLFSNGVNFKHSVYGVGFCRSYLKDNFDGTVLIFNNKTGNNITYTGTLDSDISIQNICVETNTTGVVLSLTTDNSARFSLQNFSVIGGRGIAINIYPSEPASRYIYAHNLCLWGIYESPTIGSTGIDIGKYAFDSVFDNIEIMSFQHGVKVRANVCKFNNIHIWAEATANKTTAYINDSAAFRILCDSTTISNAYCDTCFLPIVFHSGSGTILNDIFFYWGGTINYEPTCLFMVNAHKIYATNLKFNYSKITYLSNRYDLITGENFICNVIGSNAFNPLYYNVRTKIDKNYKIKVSAVADNPFVEIARIYDAYATFIFTIGNVQMIYKQISTSSAYVKSINGNVNCYFVNTGTFIKVFAELVSDGTVYVDFLTETGINPDTMLSNNNKLSFDVRSSNSGLTQATSE